MKKILIIKQTSLGDILHITPFIRAIKIKYPDSEIDVVIDKKGVSILKDNKNVNNLYEVDIYKYEKEILSSPSLFFHTIGEFFSQVFKVRNTKYDIAFDLQGLSRSVIFLYFARAKKKFAKGNWLLLKSEKLKNTHAIDVYLSFLNFIDCRDDGKQMDFYIPDEISNRVKMKLSHINLDYEYIIYSPYSRWISKNVPLSKSLSLVREIASKYDKNILISGGNENSGECERISRECDNVYNISGHLNLTEFGYIVSKSQGMISVDSFPMHLACAFNRPLVALFGPTNENLIGPLTQNSVVIRDESVKCKRCYNRKCKNNVCMLNLDEKNIVNTLLDLMNSR